MYREVLKLEEYINYAKDYFMADFNSTLDLDSFIKKVIAFNIITELIINAFPDLVDSIEVGEKQ